MSIGFLLTAFEEHSAKEAVVWNDQSYSYQWLLDGIAQWRQWLVSENIGTGTVVSLEADFSPNSVALFLTLVEQNCVVVPLAPTTVRLHPEFLDIAEVECSITIDCDDHATLTHASRQATSALYAELRKRENPGLVLFSSGSTGTSKAAVHDLTGLLAKFHLRRHALRTITFLLFDHIGGLNTLLYVLSNGGCIVTTNERSPDAVLAAIGKHRVELLPTSPTFMNLVLLSEAYKRYNLASLKIVSYGTEPMLESTLKRFHEVFPGVRLVQTYGLSEVGILRSKSKSSDSLWLKVGGEGFATRVVDGVLQIKARSAILGYLNAPNPVAEDE